MRLRIALALAELLGFILFLIALVTVWWKIPQVTAFWPTVGYTFAFLGIALAQVFVFVAILIVGRQ